MPARVIKRVTAGVTNKASSQSNLSSKKSAEKSCVCKTCTCGQHQCAEKHKSGETSVPMDHNLQLLGQSETREQFKPSKDFRAPTIVRKVTELPPKRDLVGQSEQKSQFVSKPVPPPPQPHIQKYEPNLQKLEGNSESHERYQVWPVNAPPQKFKPAKATANNLKLDDSTETGAQYQAKPIPPQSSKRENKYTPNPNKLEGVSESKESYKPYSLQSPPQSFKPEHVPLRNDKLEGGSVSHEDYQTPTETARVAPIKKVSEYKPPSGPMEEHSLYSEQFKAYANVERPKQKEKERYVAIKEDRDFTSTTKNSYVQYDASKMSAKVVTKQAYVPNRAQFEGESVNHSDFKEIDVAKSIVGRKDLKKAALTDRSGTFHLSGAQDKFAEETEYSSRYDSDGNFKDVRAQPIKPPVQTTIAGPHVKLEGESVAKTSYQAPSEIASNGLHVYDKQKDFKPAGKQESVKDDRDFRSVTKEAFQPTQCPATTLHGVARAKDGHLYPLEATN